MPSIGVNFMTDLQIFDNPEFGKVRVVTIDDEPWLVGKDVATALGYANPQKALRDHVPDRFKRTERIVHPLGGAQDTVVINEAGMYKLVMRSKLPNAEKFSDWTCEDVLPSIRKTGSYIGTDIQQIINPNFLRRIADELEARDKKIAELQPKADYCERILQSDEALAISIIAQDYGMSAMAMNKLLAKLKIQHRVGAAWVINSPYNRMGYVVNRTIERGINFYTHTYWTQKGRFFLYNTLKGAGLLPLIERDEYYPTLNFEELATC